MAKNVSIVHPAFTQVARRTAVAADLTKQYLSGRWVCVNSMGQFAIVGTAKDLPNAFGLYWLLEGTHDHIGTNLDFATVAGQAFSSSNAVQLPSVKNQGALAGAYGVFVGTTGPEGVDPSASIVNQSELTVDQYGRFVVAGSGDIRVAVAEVVTSDGNGITSVIFRTTGN
jgi:hypothetical protein